MAVSAFVSILCYIVLISVEFNNSLEIFIVFLGGKQQLMIK